MASVTAKFVNEIGDEYVVNVDGDVYAKLEKDEQYRNNFLHMLSELGVKPTKRADGGSENVMLSLLTMSGDQYHIMVDPVVLPSLEAEPVMRDQLLLSLMNLGVTPTVKADVPCTTASPSKELLCTPTKPKKGCFMKTPEAFRPSKAIASETPFNAEEWGDDFGVEPLLDIDVLPNSGTDTSADISSDTVLVGNLPPQWKKFYDKILIASIMRGMEEANFCSADEDVVKEFFDYKPDTRTVTLKFVNEELAKLCSFLLNVFCDGHELTFKIVACEGTGVPDTSKGASAQDFYSPTLEEQTLEEEEEEEGKLCFGDDDDECSLNSPSGTTKFIRNLVRLKGAFLSNTHTSAYIRLQADLINDEKVLEESCTIKKLKGKRRYLISTYNAKVESGQDDWPYFSPLAVYMGHKDITTLEGTEFHPGKCASAGHNESPLYQMAKYTKGKTWNEASIGALVKAYLQYKVAFDTQPAKHSYLYNKIHLALKEDGFYFQPAQCESKMIALKKEFRDEAGKISSTGAPGPIAVDEWPHYELMYPVMKDDVTVAPLYSVKAGMTAKTSISHAQHTKGTVLPLPVPSTSSSTVNQGIKMTRASSSRVSPSALKERSLNVLERYTAAIEKQNDIAAKKLLGEDSL